METSSVKRPSFQFYPGDWLNDAALRMVSVGARGLWMEMICLMHQGSDYGYLKVNGKVILPANLARMSGASVDETAGWISELEDAGVFARDEDGCIFSKRMIRDERVRAARAAGGKLGGNPVLVKKGKDNLTLNLDLTPSSSSSDEKPKPSSSAGADGDEVGEPEPEKAKPFDHFWAAYPRRVGKQDALKAWTKIKPDNVLLALILKAIENQKQGADWRKDEGQFIPHPATWLRAGRWLDEVRPYTAPAPKLPGGWWETPESIKAAGLMLDPPLEPRPGEGQKAFALRIRVALGEVDMPTDQVRGYTLSPPPEKIERPYMPPTVPDGVQLTDEQRQARRDELREAMKAMSEKAGNARAGVAASNERQAA